METTNKTKNAAADKAEAQKNPRIKLSDMDISVWNRSHGADLDADYVKKLAADIKANGLVNPVAIVMHKKTGRWVVVAGAHRIAALKSIRGEDGILKEGEYRIIADLDESDPRCFDLCVADNRHQRGMSLYEKAKYVRRVVEELKLDQGRVADALGLQRPYINRLVMLAEYWAKLPETVKSDFSIAPYSSGENLPVLTFSHWYEFASSFQKAGVNDEVRALMERALAERWSTRQVKEAVQLYTCGAVSPADEQPAEDNDAPDPTSGSEDAAPAAGGSKSGEAAPAPSKAPKSPRPVAACAKVVKAIRKTVDLAGDIDGLDEVQAQLEKLADVVSQKLTELQEAERAAKAAGKRKRGRPRKVPAEPAAKSTAKKPEAGE